MNDLDNVHDEIDKNLTWKQSMVRTFSESWPGGLIEGYSRWGQVSKLGGKPAFHGPTRFPPRPMGQEKVPSRV